MSVGARGQPSGDVAYVLSLLFLVSCPFSIKTLDSILFPRLSLLCVSSFTFYHLFSSVLACNIFVQSSCCLWNPFCCVSSSLLVLFLLSFFFSFSILVRARPECLPSVAAVLSILGYSRTVFLGFFSVCVSVPGENRRVLQLRDSYSAHCFHVWLGSSVLCDKWR